MRACVLRLGLAPSLLVASLSGVCFGLAAPPRPLGWLAWLGFVPLLIVLRRPQLTAWRAFALGWVAGLGVGLLGFPWMTGLLERFAGLPRPLAIGGMLLHSAWLALPFGIWAALLQWGPRRGGWAWLWALTTFPLITGLWPVVFPYTPLIGLAQHPQWIQLAELGGVAAVEIHGLLAGLCLAAAVRQSERWRAATCAGVAVGIIALSGFAGAYRMVQVENGLRDAPRVTLGIVQPNLPVLLRNPDVSMSRLRGASRDAQRAGAQIIVWPEAGTYPYPLPRPLRRDPSDPRGQILLEHQLPTIFGAATLPPEGDGAYNTMLHMDRTGRVRGQFDKVMLVPFGETIPLIPAEILRRFVRNVGQLRRGQGPARFVVQPPALEGAPPSPETVSIGPMICIEDIHASFVRHTAALPGGIELFVNSTIDAWYGVEQEPWEHLALAQFRSVEHRIPMVRSVSTGASAAIGSSGRLLQVLPPRDVTLENLAANPAQTLVVSLPIARNTELAPTLFARFGWRLPQLCWVLALSQAGVCAWLRRRRQLRISTEEQVA